ncbi:hypothetical protein DHEL01_v202900 [Diaporthe helianthi]|uniref:C6 transcription factor RegA n=1 Tax=Diaporthe helianthi TaxID=158607 RepID=A0A2P5I875_DIAHE|nr:hypothetical protein DHEL01_v202900 [Diaporthe helianthi]
MASPSLSHLLHADSSMSSHQHSQSQPQRSLSRTGAAHSASTSSPAYYTYPAPPGVSPAASATSHPTPLATPFNSPGAPSTTGGSSVAGAISNTPASGQAANGHAANTSLYQCADCLKRYSRPEHLQRHIATHTLGKRFICDVCGKAFGRADLLKRHRANHDDDGNGTKRRRINSSPGAGRVAHACQACAKARVKCEESKPCTRCRNRNLTCEYASSEAGSAAAMHLLHLSATAHSSGATTPTSSAPMAPAAHRAIPTAHHLGSRSLGSNTAEAKHTHGLHIPAAPAMTNLVHAQSTGASPSMLADNPPISAEAAQLPTPETMMDQNNPDSYHGSYPTQSPVDMNKMPFSDFLRDVIYDQQQMDSQKMVEAQGLAVLDFCDDANLEMNDLDFGMLDHWNLGDVHGMLATDPNLANYVSNQPEDTADMSRMRQRLVKIWTNSPWRWMPDGHKDNIHNQKSGLPLADIHATQLKPDRIIHDKLDSSGRDKILAIVLSTCQNNVMLSRVASSFPSTEVMDSMVHIFLAWHLCQVSEFIHFGTFSLNAQCPEWSAVAASAGGILTSVQSLRKFGFALQEAVRVTIVNRFEDNNSKVQDQSLVQALVLGHDIGLWSGNRRRMEIAECHLNIPIAMTRGRGSFQRSAYPPIRVDPADDGAVLEEKWKTWCHRESWKRLIFHLYLRDAQTSMTSMNNPHISYAELTLPLPEARELWFAKTAREWKMHYLELDAGQSRRPPSLGDLLRDISVLATDQHRLDVQYAVSIYLHGFWSLIRDYRQMNAIYRWSAFSPSTGGNPNILLQSRHQELVKALEQFQTTSLQNWPHMLSTQEKVVLHLLFMNLHVSLEDLQLFSGKEGDEQAKRIYPSLQRWAQDAESRRALWHAGQILRWAKEFPTSHLKDFYAVAVHHAALAIWTWGVLTRAIRRTAGLQPGFNHSEPIVYLDGPETSETAQFESYGTGRPAIQGPVKKGQGGGRDSAGGGSGVAESLVEDPKHTMAVVDDVFRANFLNGPVAPIVENLCHLIKQLGNAAWAVGLG